MSRIKSFRLFEYVDSDIQSDLNDFFFELKDDDYNVNLNFRLLDGDVYIKKGVGMIDCITISIYRTPEAINWLGAIPGPTGAITFPKVLPEDKHGFRFSDIYDTVYFVNSYLNGHGYYAKSIVSKLKSGKTNNSADHYFDVHDFERGKSPKELEEFNDITYLMRFEYILIGKSYLTWRVNNA